MRLLLVPALLFSSVALAGDGPAEKPPAEGQQLHEGPGRAMGVKNTDNSKRERLAALHRRCRMIDGRIEAMELELAQMDAELAELQTAVHEAKGRKATDLAMTALLDELLDQNTRRAQIYNEMAEIRVMHLKEHVDAGDTEAKGCKSLNIVLKPSAKDEEEAAAPEDTEATDEP